MNSKSRVRNSIQYKKPDRLPVSFNATQNVIDKLMDLMDADSLDELMDNLEVDIRYVEPEYIGPALESYTDTDGMKVEAHFFGWKNKYHWSGADYTPIVCEYPLDNAQTVADIEDYPWPDPNWFDYSGIRSCLERNRDRAIIAGNIGNYQVSTKIRSAEKIYMDMALNPDFAKALFGKFHEFEIEHYRRILEAGGGDIDILRVYDDYGTQASMLFSREMWWDFFSKSTRELVELAHSFGAFYMQHSCGAVGPIIEDLIECGVDILDPLQKVKGLEPETLANRYGTRIAYHGGIDTQHILPVGTPKEVASEIRAYASTLGTGGGYILSPSQAFQGDIPVENILELYRLSHRYL